MITAASMQRAIRVFMRGTIRQPGVTACHIRRQAARRRVRWRRMPAIGGAPPVARRGRSVVKGTTDVAGVPRRDARVRIRRST